MANPQPDKYTRISNELYEAIMQTNFSKRQRNILDLVIRMSYGCQKKFAILRPSDFEVVGVYRTHVKKELEYLVYAKVLQINGDQISINKNYDEWRVSVARGSNLDKFQEILRRNIVKDSVTKTVTDEEETTNEKACSDSYQNSNRVTKTVTSIEDPVTKTVTGCYQNSNDTVTETVTSGYQNSNFAVTKTVTGQPSDPLPEAGFQPPKDIIKDNIKTNIKDNIKTTTNIVGVENRQKRERKLFKTFTNQFHAIANSYQLEKLVSYLNDGMEPELIEKAIEITKENGKSLNYFFGILNRLIDQNILTLQAYEQHEAEWQRKKEDRRGGRYSGDSEASRDESAGSEISYGYYDQYPGLFKTVSDL